jgi:hypothetical protein
MGSVVQLGRKAKAFLPLGLRADYLDIVGVGGSIPPAPTTFSFGTRTQLARSTMDRAATRSTSAMKPSIASMASVRYSGSSGA